MTIIIMENLPSEIYYIIFSFLSEDNLICCLTCKRFYFELKKYLIFLYINKYSINDLIQNKKCIICKNCDTKYKIYKCYICDLTYVNIVMMV